MSKKSIHDALDMIARRGVPDNVNLWQGISSKVNRRFPMMTLRKNPAMAVLMATFIFLAAAGGVYAFGRSLGFIPGGGFVEKESSVLVLKEPVSVNQMGIEITINQVVADSVQTLILYTVEVKDETTLQNQEGITAGKPLCESIPDYVSHSIRLPDGQVLSGGSSGPDPDKTNIKNGFTGFKAIDPPLPHGVNTFTFMLGCDQGEVAVQLVPAPADFILPVRTVEKTETDGVSQTTTTGDDSTAGKVQPQMMVESFVEVEDGYVLIGYRQLENQDGHSLLPITFESMSVTDASGARVEGMDVPQQQNYWPESVNSNRDYWVIKVLGKNHVWPLTVAHQPAIKLSDKEVASFQIDLGENPQAGQTWKLNMDVVMESIGTLHIDSARLFKGTAPLEDPNAYGLEFVITNASPMVKLIDKDHDSQILGGGGGPEEYNIQLMYSGGYTPSGLLNMRVIYTGQYDGQVLKVDWKP